MFKNCKNILLLGFMGAGKSTVGREIAQRLGWRYVDLDACIEANEGRTIRDIFAVQGEEFFRDLETAALRRFSSCEGAVIATGGGIVQRAENRQLLNKMGRTVYLKAGFETLRRRMTSSDARPLADFSEEGLSKLKSLLLAREAFYLQADLIIDTDHLDPANVAARIVAETVHEEERPGRDEVAVALGEKSYSIFIGSGILGSLGEFLISRGFPRKVALVTNTTVYPLYGERVEVGLRRSGFEAKTMVLPDGEEHKNQNTVTSIYDHLIDSGLDRGCALIALGGGVVGDIAGFAAATFMRGIPYVQVPTTLLSQVDSSVGGKTGVNHPLGKNLIGAFHQPRLVLVDVETLKSLPRREFSAGMAEVIKYGMIWDGDFFAWLQEKAESLAVLDIPSLISVIGRSCRIKAEIVGRDEHENSLRAVLNYGHTFGHAIENLAGYGVYRHGEAVAIGMHVAALGSWRRGYCARQDVDRLLRLLEAFHLPIEPPLYSLERFLTAMKRDKKSQGGVLRFVFNQGIGAYRLEDLPVPETFFAEILADFGRGQPRIG